MLEDLRRGARPARGYQLLLDSPWGFPADPELADRVPAGRRSEAELGQTLGVSVDPTGDKACLWHLGPGASGGTAVPLGGRVRLDLACARRLVVRELPLVDPGAAAVAAALPTLLWAADGQVTALDGPSMGLACCLSEASLALGLPVPRDLVASVEVSPDGALHPVSGVEAKAKAVATCALAVRRFLVHVDQVDRVVEASRAAGRELEAIGVRTLSDAIRVAFPDLEQALPARWQDDPAAAARAAAALQRAALFNEPLILDWAGVARSAAHLERSPDLAVAGQAKVARAIAERHAGLAAVMQWPADEDLARLPRPLRGRWIAHVVQSGADADDRTALDYAARALRSLSSNPLDHIPEDLMALGAVGRAYAAAGRYPEATRALEQALRGWVALGSAREASHPLCELLRVHGLLCDLPAIEGLVADAVRPVIEDLATTELSRAFVVLAWGRACVQAGDAAAGERLLRSERVEWRLTPAHLRAARLRWLAHVGDDGALAELRLLDGRGEVRCLAELDRAVRDGDPEEAERWLRELLLAEAGRNCDAARVLARPGADAAAVARHYRY